MSQDSVNAEYCKERCVERSSRTLNGQLTWTKEQSWSECGGEASKTDSQAVRVTFRIECLPTSPSEALVYVGLQ